MPFGTTFFQAGVARMMCVALPSYAQQLQAKWQATRADDDVKRNDISHGFLSTKDPSAAPGLEQLFRLFHLLLPEELNTFSVAR